MKKNNTSYKIGSQNFSQDNLNKMTGTDANAIYYATHQGNKKANTMFSNPGSFVDTGEQKKPSKEEYDQLVNQIAKIRKSVEEPKTVPALNKKEEKQKVSYLSNKQKENINNSKYALKQSLDNNYRNPMLNGSASFSNQKTSSDSLGKYGKGNIDLTNRPQYKNEDGSISTVRSMSFNEEGKEILVPTVDYSKHGEPILLTDEQAIDRYHRTGEFLGKFDTVKEADEYAEALHQQQEDLYSDEAFIRRALDPNYKLSSEEKKRAKKIVREYEDAHANDANPNATELVFDEEHPDGYMKPMAELSDEEKAEQENIYALRDKISKGESALMGAMRTTPGVTALTKAGDNDGYWENATTNAQKQNPLSYYGGLVGNGILMNKAAQYLLGGTSWGDTVDKLIGVGKEGISEGSKVARQIVADSLKDMPVDLATDILPELAIDIADKKSVPTIIKNTLGNTALNGGLNTIAAGLGNLDEVRDVLRLNKATKENIRNLEDIILKNTDEAPILPEINNNIDIDNIDWGKYIDENREWMKGVEQDILNNTDEVTPLPTLKKGVDIDNIRWGLGDKTADPNALIEERNAIIDSLNQKGQSMTDMLEKNKRIKDIDELLSEQRPDLYRDGKYVGENFKTFDTLDEELPESSMISADDIHIKSTGGKKKKYYVTFGEDDTPLFSREIEHARDIDESIPDVESVPREFASKEEAQNAIDEFLRKQSAPAVAETPVEQVAKNTSPLSEIESAIKNKDFKPITFTDGNSTYVISRSTRPGEKWQLSHIADTGDFSGHSAFKTDEELMSTLGDAQNISNIRYGEAPDIITAPSASLGEMLQNPDKYTDDDFMRAMRTYDRNADVDGAEREDIINVLREEVANNPESANTPVKMPNKVVAENANPTVSITENVKSADEVKPAEEVAKPTKDTADKVVDDIVEEAKKEASEGTNQKVSKAYTNTAKNGGGYNETEYNKYTDPNRYTYESSDEIESVNKATELRATEGREAFKNRVMQKEKLASYEIDGLMMEWRETIEEARELEAQGLDASDLWEESNRIFKKIQSEESQYAQSLQALAKWSRNTPEGMLMQAEQIVNKRIQKMKPDKNAAEKVLDRILRKHDDIEFSSDFQKNFLEKAEDIYNMTDMDSREAKDAMAELGRMIANELPVKLPDKIMAYLMNNMLGNFRTLITRNAGGNLGLNAVEQIAQRPLAAGIDVLVSKKTGVRKQAGLTKEGLMEYMSGFKKGLSDEAHDFKTGLHTARSGENTLENAVNANRHVFNGKNPISKFLNLKDKLVRTGLSVGDRPFYEAVYNQTIGDYHRLREMGQMGEAIQNLSDADFDLYAKTAASLNALSAVYQNDSKFARALLDFKKAIGELSEGTIGVDILSQFSMPFVKTPANVIDRAIDYSPLGLLRNGIRTAKEGGIGGANFDQGRFVNELSRNIIGTGLMGGAAAGANAGRMSGAYSENQEEKQAQKRSGMQEYAWNVPDWIPALGGKQMDVSWLPVVGSNAVAAAAAVDAYKKGKGNVAENIGTGLKKGGEALFDQSMFQGLQRLFGSDGSYDSDSSIVENALNTVKKGVSQVIPSLARQAGQVIDPYQRDVSNSNYGNYDLNSLINNIPIARQYLLAPKVGDGGELMMENQGRNIGSKILEDMILPGKLTEVNENPLDVEAKRLSEETGNTVAYRPKASRKNVDTDEHKLTNEEWVNYEQNFEKATTDIGNAIVDSDFYQNASDPVKEKLLDNAYADVRNAINSDYNGKELKGGAKVYKEAGGGEEGIKALTDYYEDKAYKNEVEEAMGSSSEFATALYEEGDPKRIAKYNEAKAICDAEGVNMTENQFLTYETYGKWELKKELRYAKTANEIGVGAANKTYRKLLDSGMSSKAIKQAYDDITSIVTGKDEFNRDEHLSFDDETYDVWKKYKEQGLKDYAEIKAGKANWNTYRQARISYPSLSAKEYVSIFNSLDGNTGSKPNGTVDQGELLNYYNSHNVKESEAQKMWQAYGVHSGDNAWKKVPVLKKNNKTGKTEWQAVQLKKGK